MVNFLLRSQTVILTLLLFWIYFFFLMLVFVLQWLFLHWKIMIMLLSQFLLTFHQIHNGCPISLHSLWLFRPDWDGLCDYFRDVPWKDIFQLSTSATASEFCHWVQVRLDVYLPHQKYQVKPHSSLWFSVACATAIVHRTTLSFVSTE